MPHRVAAFIRSSTNSLENQVNQVIHLKKSNVRSRTKSPHRITAGGVSEAPSSHADRVGSSASSINENMDEPSPMSETTNNNNTSHPQPATQAAAAGGGGRSANSPRIRPKLEGHDKDHSHHRLSFPGLHLGRSHKDNHHHHQHANPHVQVSWKVESPPIIFYGDAENSTGALVSGQLYLDIKDDAGYAIDTFTATLHIRVTQKKPFAPHCADCASQLTLLKEWTFLAAHPAGVPLHKGVHPFPFSVLLDGHLPATLDSPLVNIAYEFKAEAVPARQQPGGVGSSSSSGAALQQPIKLEKVFDVKRSLPPPELPHHSVRVFPPTNVKASVHYQQVIHPIGSNTLTMRLDGIARLNDGSGQPSTTTLTTSSGGSGTVEYWKLKKLTWRLEETLKTVAPACAKHKPTSTTSDDPQQQPKQGLPRTETRTIGEKTLFSGWKSTYTTPNDSHIELELDYSLNTKVAAAKAYACNLRARDGTEVSHQLMLELVVSQECAPAGRPALVTQTGVGRILRMHFGTVLTERGGIGISWDNEAPPIYQDVPPSPPGYWEEEEDGGGGAAMEGLLPEVMESLDATAVPGPSGVVSGENSRRNSVERVR